MARTTIESSNPTKRSADPSVNAMPPGKKRMAIAAVVLLVISIGTIVWYLASSEPEYQETKGQPPPETTQLTITNTTNSPASVIVRVEGETSPPTGFAGEGGVPVKDPMKISLEAQQFDRFMFADGASKPTDPPAEIEVEANIGGTTIKGTFMVARRKKCVLNLYDATGTPTFDVGPGVTQK